MAGTNTLLSRIYGLTDTHNRRPQLSDFIGLNQESDQIRDLQMAFPLWEGGGAIRDVGPYALVGIPTNTLWAWDQHFGMVSYWDGGPPTGAAHAPSLIRNYEVIDPKSGYSNGKFPDMLDPGKVTGGLVPSKLTAKSFSLCAWVRLIIKAEAIPTANNPPNAYICTFDSNNAAAFPGYGFGYSTYGNATDPTPIVAEWDVDSDSIQSSIFGRRKINDGLWHHIVAVYDSPDIGGGHMLTYVDGALDQTEVLGDPTGLLNVEVPSLESAAGHNATPIGRFFIGADDDGKSAPMNGWLCDLRYYNRALSPLDVAAMFAPDTRWQLYQPRRSYAAFPKPPLTPNLADAPTTTDSVSRVMTFVRSFSDAPTTVDAVSRLVTFVRSLSDLVHPDPSNDYVFVNLQILLRSISDAPTTMDAVSRVETLLRSTTDASNTTDALSAIVSGTVTLADAPTTIDALSRLVTFVRSLTDAPQMVDSVARLLTLVRALSSAITTTDSLTKVLVLVRALADAPLTTSTVSRIVSENRSLADAPTTADSVLRLETLLRSLADAPQTTDTVSKVLTLLRTLADTPTTTDAVARLPGADRNLSDDPVVTDSLTRSETVVRSLVDAPQTLDTVTTTTTHPRTIVDTPSTTDAVSPDVGVARSLADTPQTSDDLSKLAVFYRTLLSAVHTTDAITYSTTGTSSQVVGKTYYAPDRQGSFATTDRQGRFRSKDRRGDFETVDRDD